MESVVRNLRDQKHLDSTVLVLIGSHARERATPRSDVDLLLITRGIEKPTLERMPGVHVHVVEESVFTQRFKQADDFVISSVKYGRLVHDSQGYWKQLQETVSHAPMPSWSNHLGHARQRIDMGDALARLDDIDAAEEEYLLAATQIARALLLRIHKHPLSRPELGEQMRAIGERKLASILSSLIEGVSDRKMLGRVDRELKAALSRLT